MRRRALLCAALLAGGFTSLTGFAETCTSGLDPVARSWEAHIPTIQERYELGLAKFWENSVPEHYGMAFARSEPHALFSAQLGFHTRVTEESLVMVPPDHWETIARGILRATRDFARVPGKKAPLIFAIPFQHERSGRYVLSIPFRDHAPSPENWHPISRQDLPTEVLFEAIREGRIPWMYLLNHDFAHVSASVTDQEWALAIRSRVKALLNEGFEPGKIFREGYNPLDPEWGGLYLRWLAIWESLSVPHPEAWGINEILAPEIYRPDGPEHVNDYRGRLFLDPNLFERAERMLAEEVRLIDYYGPNLRSPANRAMIFDQTKTIGARLYAILAKRRQPFDFRSDLAREFALAQEGLAGMAWEIRTMLRVYRGDLSPQDLGTNFFDMRPILRRAGMTDLETSAIRFGIADRLARIHFAIKTWFDVGLSPRQLARESLRKELHPDSRSLYYHQEFAAPWTVLRHAYKRPK